MADLTSHPQYLAPISLGCSTEEMFYNFKIGTKKFFKTDLPTKSIIILLAHSALETGRWNKGFYSYNLGNIRANVNKLKLNEYFTLYKCSEILNGKEQWFYPPDPMCSFRAFKTMDDGIAHHLAFLTKSRYQLAWQKILAGDPSGYSMALHDCGYYTASPTLYTKGLVRLTEEFMAKSKTLSEWQPTMPVAPSEPEPLFTDWELQQIGGIAAITAQDSYRLFARKDIDEYEDYYRVVPNWWNKLKSKVFG
jgi:hypothetical protein